MNGRVYDPRTGRFLSPDPIVEDPAFGQSWHSYSYVANSPLSLADPTGLFAQCPIPTLGFSCDPAASPGGFGGAIDTIFSFIHRYWFDFYVYRAPSFSLTFGDEGIDVEFDVVDLIGVAVSVVSEIVSREVRFEGKGEAGEPIGDGFADGSPLIVGSEELIGFIERRSLERIEEKLEEGFETQDEAAMYLHDKLYGLSREFNVEIGSRIYRKELYGRWYVTPPNTDGLPREVSRAPAPENAIGGTASVWHTHPSGAPPSPSDTNFGGDATTMRLYVSHMVDGKPVLSVIDDLIPGWFEPVTKGMDR